MRWSPGVWIFEVSGSQFLYLATSPARNLSISSLQSLKDNHILNEQQGQRKKDPIDLYGHASE